MSRHNLTGFSARLQSRSWPGLVLIWKIYWGRVRFQAHMLFQAVRLRAVVFCGHSQFLATRHSLLNSSQHSSLLHLASVGECLPVRWMLWSYKTQSWKWSAVTFACSIRASYIGPAHTQTEGIAHRSGCPEAGIIRRHFIVSFYLSFLHKRKRKHSFSIINKVVLLFKANSNSVDHFSPCITWERPEQRVTWDFKPGSLGESSMLCLHASIQRSVKHEGEHSIWTVIPVTTCKYWFTCYLLKQE